MLERQRESCTLTHTHRLGAAAADAGAAKFSLNYSNECQKNELVQHVVTVENAFVSAIRISGF